MKNFKKGLIVIPIAILVILVSMIVIYNVNLSGKGINQDVEFTINENTPTVTIINNLKEDDLIKSTFFTKIFVKLNNSKPQAGKYLLNKNMSVSDIFNMFNNGDVIKNNITLTLVEGKRLENYAKTIESTFNFEENSVLNLLTNKEFINSLIDKYWFITDEVNNSKLYYALEGYLYPDTYEFEKESTKEEVVIKLIETLGKKLEPYRENIENSKYSVHNLLTLASIVELEAASEEDRNLVAGVFTNRLNNSWSLGSDVTTFYAARKSFQDPLTYKDLEECNAYNTRSTCLIGLPVGPICSPSITSIKASIIPAETDYFYFVADATKKVYFSKTFEEQLKVINDLKSKGLWLA